MTIPASELAAWSELAEKATPGPWRTSGYVPHSVFLDESIGGHVVSAGPSSKGTQDDAAFIAASREALPRLLSAYSQSQARVAELEAAIEKHRADSRFSPHGWGFREQALWSVLPQSEGAE